MLFTDLSLCSTYSHFARVLIGPIILMLDFFLQALGYVLSDILIRRHCSFSVCALPPPLSLTCLYGLPLFKLIGYMAWQQSIQQSFCLLFFNHQVLRQDSQFLLQTERNTHTHTNKNLKFSH